MKCLWRKTQRQNLTVSFLAYLEFLCAHYCLLEASLWIISLSTPEKITFFLFFFALPSRLRTFKAMKHNPAAEFSQRGALFSFCLCDLSLATPPLSVSAPDALGCTVPPPSV